MNKPDSIVIATRGSALALAQAHEIFDQCRKAFPRLKFEIKIIKTTGDKLQTVKLSREGLELPKGLFTKELEVALLKHRADLAVHSLKDLPTEIPAGLTLGAISKREDVRDVLIYRDAESLERAESPSAMADWTPGQSKRRGFGVLKSMSDFPRGTVVATSSTRRVAQVLAANPGLKTVEIRGNVVTRLQRLAENQEIDATILAFAGLKRLRFSIESSGMLTGDAVPEGLRATLLPIEEMLPCVGQGALGIEIRSGDERMAPICERLNHYNTMQAATAERAFLGAMGGGCQSPVGAYAEVVSNTLRLRAISFVSQPPIKGEIKGALTEPKELGSNLALQLGGQIIDAGDIKAQPEEPS